MKNKTVQRIADEFGMEYRADDVFDTVRHTLIRRDGFISARFEGRGRPNVYLYVNGIAVGTANIWVKGLSHLAKSVCTHLQLADARKLLENHALNINRRINDLHKQAQELSAKHREITDALAKMNEVA
jgi:hypothetical protein